MKLQRVFLFLSLFLFARLCVHGQTMEDLSNVKVEELTDDQIRRFVVEADRLGMKDEQIEDLALQRGMNPVEIVKLKDRVQAMRKAMGGAAPVDGGTKVTGRQMDSISALEQRPLTDFNTVFGSLRMRNFGAGVFNNPRISFEPNMRLPTPKNYQLAADDELLIDVSGYSEANYRLKVSPEGRIRIPVAGSVVVNGLTIEQAKRLIIQKLSNTIYSDIRRGHTSVEVTLGSIRSIKITIIGEATIPGTYTLPSLATAYNALYACGGPGLNGSYRNIQVIRNNATVAEIDVYQYLTTGSKKHDIRLMDQDVIRINTYSTRVELKGEVKKPGLYDVKEGETLGTLIRYAGGYTDNAYTAKIQVFRNTSKDREVTTIAESRIEHLIPRRGDSYIIGKILNRFTNRVSIKGAVYRPGEYELKEGMTVRNLIEEADGIREDAFGNRAIIHRLKDDLSPEIVSFEPEKLLNGSIPDIVLKKEDRVTLYSRFDLKEGYYVSMEGEVANPGVFLYEEGITVQDLILLAGGLKESASVQRIEISRRVKDADPKSPNRKTAIIFEQNITQDLRDSASFARFVLSPFDEVVIRPAPGYSVQKNAFIEGEAIYTGKYTLQAKGDRISDLVKRAGGLTPEAYLEGAVLVRTRNLTRAEQSNIEQGLNNLLKQSYEAGGSTAVVQNDLNRIAQKKSDNVGIDLRKILDHPGSEYDLLLNDGDTLRIPKQLQTVRVNGEVLYPTLVRYDKEMGFKDYILDAGGFSERSSKKKSYIVYANGSVKGTRSFLFFRHYPKVTPGAEIYVPMKRERERLRIVEVVSLVVTLATLLVIAFK